MLNYVNNPVLSQEECLECLPAYIEPGMLCWGYCGSNNRSTCNVSSLNPVVDLELGGGPSRIKT